MALAVGFLTISALSDGAIVTDTAIKTAAVDLVDMETDTLGGVVSKLVGDTGAVDAAVDAGKEVGARLGIEVGGYVNAAYDDEAAEQWITTPLVWHGMLGSRVSYIPQDEAAASPMALGFLETRGAVGAIASVDEMCKTASVAFVGYERTGAIRVVSVIRGDVASVSESVAAGAAIASKVGDLVTTHVIPRPHQLIASLWPASQESEPELPAEQNQSSAPDSEV
ncbi:MAG: BMC domain-containing protein [Candidatus Latescibacteria bacterium]|jgi:microcompartment protein CcmL/EutN|nr:BMC domain-containing protein [Candidatus Latescibacterota bacterium]